MKKVNVKKEILVVLLIVAIMVAISGSVFATGQINIPGINTDANAVTETNTITINTINTNTTTNTVVNTAVITPVTTNTTTNTQGSQYTNTSLPQTGDASDYAIFAVIAVAIVVAIYAYKKVRDYNI